MMGRIVFYAGWYTPRLCQLHPDKTFIFGDNLLGYGTGGQAIIRYEPNAVGIPTKRKPAMSHGSFFEEGNEDDLDAVLHHIGELWHLLQEGNTLVIPVTRDGKVSLGRERAELPTRAPTIYEAICRHVTEMADWCEVVAHVENEEGLSKAF